jgi:hypothetical protein
MFRREPERIDLAPPAPTAQAGQAAFCNTTR